MADSATATVTNAASYVWGTCTWFIAQTFSWIPAGLGNAKDWLANAQRKGLSTTNFPEVGDVVVYGPGHGYDPNYGHVAIVTGVLPPDRGQPVRFTVKEMNAQGLDVVSTRTSTMADVLGFIQPPNSASTGGTTSGGSGAQDCSQYNPFDPRYYLCQTQNALQSVGNIPGNVETWLGSETQKWAVRIALIGVGVLLLVVGLVILFRPSIEAGAQQAEKLAPLAAL